MQKDPYQILGVTRDAPPEVVRAAYRALAQTYHPDRNNSPTASRRMQALNAAYAVVSDADRRASFNASNPAHDSAPSAARTADSAPGGFQSPAAPLQRSVRDVNYELVFAEGFVTESKEWTDQKHTLDRDNRLFIGRGQRIRVEHIAKQKLWLRVGSRDVLVERSGDILPVARGHGVTLVTLRGRGNSSALQHIALVNRSTGRWYVMKELNVAVDGIMRLGAQCIDLLKLLGFMAATSCALYYFVLRGGGFSSWVIALLSVPIWWGMAPWIIRSTAQAVEQDIREALSTAGLSRSG